MDLSRNSLLSPSPQLPAIEALLQASAAKKRGAPLPPPPVCSYSFPWGEAGCHSVSLPDSCCRNSVLSRHAQRMGFPFLTKLKLRMQALLQMQRLRTLEPYYTHPSVLLGWKFHARGGKRRSEAAPSPLPPPQPVLTQSHRAGRSLW